MFVITEQDTEQVHGQTIMLGQTRHRQNRLRQTRPTNYIVDKTRGQNRSSSTK